MLRQGALVAIFLAVGALGVSAQDFVRITDPTNPVVTDLFESGGGSWIDVDNDGDLDLFVPHGNLTSQNNALYLNLGGFAFQSVTGSPVVADGGTSIGGCWGDFNADNQIDLFVTNRNGFGNFLYRGLGPLGFERIVSGAPATDLGNSNSSSWVDVDNDLDLDLYVVNFQGDDFFYRNDGPPAYALTRIIVPSLTPGTEFSIHGAWADFDNDGDMDLFVGIAGNQNDALFVNQGAMAFVRQNILDGRTTLGASWGDFDNDGDLDLFAANYLGQVSLLYRNSGSPGFTFTPVATADFPATPGNAVGSAWGDVDNDGDLDLLVANDNGEAEALYINAGAPSYSFTRVAGGGLATSAGNSFGCSLADIDADGDLDAFVANRLNQVDALFRNDTSGGNWLTLRLAGLVSNTAAIGARVRMHAVIGGAPRWQSRQVLPLTGYNSQNLDVHFGLGSATEADSVEILWPSGIRQLLTQVAAGQHIAVTEDPSTAVPEQIAAGSVQQLSAWPNPGRGPMNLRFALAGAEDAVLELFDVAGRRLHRAAVPAPAAGMRVTNFSLPEHLESGVYFVHLRQGMQRDAMRIVLLR